MKKLGKLYKLADEYKVDIHFFDLKEIGTLGINIEKEGLPHMVLLDNSLKKDDRVHLEVLAHELGHYFTTVGNFINNTIIYSDSLEINKAENKADRWACEYLITEEEIIKLLNENVVGMDDLAYYLGVSVKILTKRLGYLALKKQMLDLGENKYLVLTNLPSLYVYESIGLKHGN
jgi:hypothetical protein